ncbi:MAG: glycosyltransferase [Acetobacteraceae bacterium]
MTPPRDILVDARALQDPEYATRGIGRLASNLLADARTALPELAGSRLIALVDHAMPPLSPAHRALFDAERSTAWPASLARPLWFVALSPMTHDPLFAAPLLRDASIFSATIVYDFIPFDQPDRYLAKPAARLRYMTALAWLGRYRLFLPISEASASRLSALLPVAGSRVSVIGAPLAPVFIADGSAGPRRHVLVAGGADERKNVACALRAHAASGALQETRIPIVVTGRYDPAEIARFTRLYASVGGAPALLGFAGPADDPTLAGLYREALAVVVPSRAEGFSLPVIEGMAAGAPALASAIPAHAELIPDPALLFPPDDVSALRALLERVHHEPAFAAAIVAEQATVWPRFRAERVAERFWQAAAAEAAGSASAELPARPRVLRGRRPRLALLTPLPPDRSGVADYSAASLAELGSRVELHLFTATKSPARVRGAASIRGLSALPFVSGAFDRVVCVLGNSDFHLGIFRLLLRHGGAAIAHDARMLGFYRILLGMERARAVAFAELGRPVTAAEIENWLADEAGMPTLFFGELAAACTPLIFHSPLTARLAAGRYRIPPLWLPFALYRRWSAEALQPAERPAARVRLGLPPEEVVLASFGYVTATKCPEECVWALEMLLAWGVPARLVFVGALEGDRAALRALVQRLDLSDRVSFLDGYQSEAEYRDWLLAADIGIQLRSFGFDGLSGGLADCIAAALPTVANAELAEAMEAPAFVHTIPDPVSPVLLANKVADLLADGAHRRRPIAASAAYAAGHDFARYADGLCTLLGLDESRSKAA